jgi:hypothetical protein
MEVPPASRPAVRTVEIGPPSARAETWNVLRAGALIALVTWIYIVDTTEPDGSGAGLKGGAGAAAASVAAAATGTTAAATRGGAEARDLLPYQRLFRTLEGEDQRLFRELQEGLIEAENVRSSARRWPAPAALAAQGIPPFADAPGRGGRRNYRWQLRQEGLIVNYLGMPADARDPAFLLLVQEPDPRAPAAGPAQPASAGAGAPARGTEAASAASGVLAQTTDEVHHRLPDGTLLHVSTWMLAGAASRDDPGLIAEPYARGWNQLLIGAAPR